ncbi:hypothetical protein [Geotalea toluenoxydans]|uniref:hypothetical protein n=1 Tax=Geotalea toluenoxydans TaxID=421624 RepID=UPI0006D137D7|nr:hypothetical protein [Geotalea toluenoxydans]
MKRLMLFALVAGLFLALLGCGDSNRTEPQVFVTDILSNKAFDGDIEVTQTSTIFTQGADTIFVGIDPVSLSESRAFLDFSLSTVPSNAVINSATLSIFINSIEFRGALGAVPIRIDLISYDPARLVESDFFRTPALSTTIQPPIGPADVQNDVTVDITPLIIEAQRLGLPALQLRLVAENLSTAAGLVAIDERSFAPLLTVEYF